jgi:hypothetical protein
MKKKPQQEFPGYPSYPAKDDMFNHAKETDIDPETRSEKTPVEKTGKLNEKNFKEDVTGGDLDVPGAELDDEQENIGSEDEENNLYSFGGDNHDD